jgi:DNA segregation ATPase FtsK/SpoIIIE and related proteins
MIDYGMILQTVQKLNIFVENADFTIQQTWAKFNADKSRLASQHDAAIRKLETDFNSNKNALNSKAKGILNEAEKIHKDILRLDATLVNADKYYVKTKNKKEEELAGIQSDKHTGDTDFFEGMKTIRDHYQALTAKYSQDILPALINGLNYLFSSKRKKDYEELIVLKNTVEAFIKEINQTIPELTCDNIQELDSSYSQNKRHLNDRNAFAQQHLIQQYGTDTESLADLICEQLDEIFPEIMLSQFAEITKHYYDDLCKVNTSSQNDKDYFVLGFLDYALGLYVQSPILASLIQDKCTPILVDGQILRFPIVCPKTQVISWMIRNDGSGNEEILKFMQSIMLTYLSEAPMTQLTYSIIDPESRGNSVSPFYDIRKKLPNLFDNKVFITKDDIFDKLNNLNEYIDQMLQNRIGSHYETIYDYEKENMDFNVPLQLLLIYDFPKGFDEQSLAALRNVLRSGYRCGISVVIYNDTINGLTGYNSIVEATHLIDEMCTVVEQQGSELIWCGLNVSYLELPQKQELSKFFNKYLLIYEGIKNRGLAFPAIIKRLMDITDPAELENHVKFIIDMMRHHENAWNRVPALDATFPKTVMLGTVDYPMDIFSDSYGFESTQKTFGSKPFNDDDPGVAELPLTCDLSSMFNLFLTCPETSHKEILSYTHHVIWSFLSALPISKVNLCIIDGELRGNSVIPFLDFKKRVPDIFDQQIYTSQDEISDRLSKLNRSIDEFIQDKLGNKYANILEYNINTPKRAEAITLIVIYDFPRGFDNRNIELLLNILKNGSKCGIYTVICYNPDIQYNRYDSIEEKLEDIMKFCASVEYRDKAYMLLPYNLPIKIKLPMASNDSDQYISEYEKHHMFLKKQGLAFSDILAPELFSNKTSKNLSIPFGIGDGDSIVNLVFGEGSSHHCLIAGATGGGKSTLLHTLIMSCMLHFSPDQLHLYLMDFKSGTEFKIYETAKLPHIQLIALDAMQEFGESILFELVNEMTRRSDKLKDSGTTKISDYIEKTGDPMPRILVIMDEYQILFNDKTNRKVAGNCAELAHRIVTEGRSFGIHLLMASQTTKVLPDLTLSRGTVDQMRIRIGLKCDSDAPFMFGDNNNNDMRAVDLMAGPQGTGVMCLDYTESELVGLQVVYCDPKTQRECLDQIVEQYSEMPSNAQIFEGSRTTPLVKFFNQNQIGLSDVTPPVIYLGNLIKVAPPLALKIDRRRKHNLLICGANDRMSENITNIYMLSALMNSNSKVFCIDGEFMVGDSASEEIYSAFEKFGSRFQLATNREQIIKFINEVYSIYSERKKKNSDQPIFVFIKSLQFLDIVRKMLNDEDVDESEYADAPTANTEDDPTGLGFIEDMDNSNQSYMTVSSKLLKLIDDGSGFGISFIVSSAECQVIKETMQYGGGGPILPKFPERIIFSLGESDADYLIDNVSVANLKDNIVYFTDGIKNTFQLKPYIMPSSVELEAFLTGLLGGDNG